MQSNNDLPLQQSSSNNEYDLERFFNISPSILCIATHEGLLRKANPSFAKILGYTVDELMQNPVNYYIHPEDRKNTDKLRNDINNDIPMINFENRYITKNGDIVWLSWTSISEPEDQLIYAIAKDVTQVKKLEEKRNLLLIEVTRLNSELKNFAYMTSHDLRSPVDNIITLFSLMDFPKIEDSETLKYIEIFYSSVLQLKQTLNRHLETISTEKKINIDLTDLSLNDTLNSVKDSINELIKTSKTTLIVDFSEVPNINFSSFYLQSIFLNLISNSIKYAKHKRNPIISITSKKINNQTQIIFSDNGMGFDSSNSDSVFNLHQTFHNNEESKGIGLFLVKSHIESSGGSIHVKSKINIGTTFTITIKQ